MVGIKIGDRIAKLGLSPEITLRANNIYRLLPSEIKASRLVNQIVYLVVSEAYKSLQIFYDPLALAQQLGVTSLNALLKKASRMGYSPVICHYTPHGKLREYMRFMGIREEHHEDLSKMVDLVLDRHPQLHEKTPQSVAAGVVCFFAYINGYEYDEANFAAQSGVSVNIIKAIKKKVSQAHDL